MKSIVLMFILMFAHTGKSQTQTLPATNSEIMAYVKAHENKKISRGECWDLVQGALNHVEANWTSPETFGKPVLLNKILPGDIIAFKNVTLEGALYKQSFGQHYAIVYRINDDGSIMIAHQNYNNVRTVRFDKITPKDKTKGDLTFFRPQPKQ